MGMLGPIQPNSVHHGECVPLMRGLPPLSVDHCIWDPPYSEQVHTCSRRGITNYKERKGDAARIARTRDLGFEHLTPRQRTSYAKQAARITRRWALFFCDIEGVHGWQTSLERAGMEYVRTLVWHKMGATPQMTGDRPASWTEAIVLAHQTHSNGKPMAKRWNRGGRGNLYPFPIVLNRSGKDPRWHTTQKPIALMEALVRDFTDPGESILDAFAGSGTTILAARALGRVGFGIERDPKVVANARRRLQLTHDQQALALYRTTR